MSKNEIWIEFQNLLEKIYESQSLVRKENKFLNKNQNMTQYINIFTNKVKEFKETEIQVLNELLSMILFNFFLFEYDNF